MKVRLALRQDSKMKAVIGLCVKLSLGFSLFTAEAGFAQKAKKDPVAAGLEELKMIEGNESENDLRSLKAEMLIKMTEEKAIAQAQKLIRKYRGSPLEPDLHFRLAELYMRRSKSDRFFEFNRESETVVRLAPRVVKAASSRRSIEKAIETYELIQKRFPRFDQIDLVLFNNAFARQGLGQDKQAEKLYLFLINNFKTSPLIPDAYLSVGEINFDRAKFKVALEHFNAIRQFPDSRVYPYGLYKAAWSQYNLRETEAGLKKLEEVVAYGKYVTQNQIESRLDLRKEALFDMTLFYSDVYLAKDAFKYFKKQAGELDVGPTILRLAKLYDRHSRYREMHIVLNAFMDNLPYSPLVPTVQNEIVWTHENLREKNFAIAEMEKLYSICDSRSSWSKSQFAELVKKDPQAKLSLATPKYLEECQAMLSETTLKLAGKWLKIWKKNPAATEFADVTEKAFEIFLRRDPEGQEAGEARYAYAELLFQRDKFRQASIEYARVNSRPVGPEISHDASYAALLSLEKAVKEKWSDADEKLFKELVQVYVTQHPKGKYRLDVEFKVGLIVYEKGRYDEAAPIFVRLGKEYAKTEKGEKSQDLYLDILNLKKDYAGLKEYSKTLLVSEKSPERSKKLKDIFEQSSFLEIQGMEEKGELKVALTRFQDFAKAHPTSGLAEKALWNIMHLQFKTGDSFSGAESAVAYYDKYPKSKEAVDALLRAAQTYEDTAQLEEAAKVLVKLISAEPSSKVKWQGLAADFFLLSGRHIQARKFYEELMKSSDEKVALHAVTQLSYIEKTYGTAQSQAQFMKEMAKTQFEPLASESKMKELESLFAAGKMTEAFNEARKIVGSKTSNEYKARARFIQARILEEEFNAQSVRSRVDRVAIVLALKTEKLEKAQKAYQAAIRYGDPKVSIESLERLSHSYSSYVKALKGMPIPEGLSQDEGAAFQSELQQLAVPLEEKGVETMAQALEVARKARLRDGTLARLQRSLDELNMKKTTEVLVEYKKPELVLPQASGVGS